MNRQKPTVRMYYMMIMAKMKDGSYRPHLGRIDTPQQLHTAQQNCIKESKITYGNAQCIILWEFNPSQQIYGMMLESLMRGIDSGKLIPEWRIDISNEA